MLTTAPPVHDATVNPHLLENVLMPQVLKPGRYLGMEQGAYRKPFTSAHVRLALAFPDVYEIGISNYALKLLYSVVNQVPDFLCDRVYAPGADMRALMQQHHLPLFGVESRRPLAAFDAVAFSLQYELNYTTVLAMLEAAQLPLRSHQRQQQPWPLVLAGGPGATHPAPLSAFVDAFMVGDGEEMLLEVLGCIQQAKAQGCGKPETLAALAGIEGVYVPGHSQRVYKRIVNIAERTVDVAPLIPAVGAVHDRVVVEARRGCDRMCRFCQPCFINLPVREQSIEAIKKSALAEIEKTGYEECSLLSLSIADYSHFEPLILDVAEALGQEGVALSLPSQRADRFSLPVAEAVQQVRKSTLTFAPEAGSARLRDVINKNLTDEEILRAVTSAYQAGWNKVKLYFMIGLPTETTADLDAIVSLVQQLKSACRQLKRQPGLSMRQQLEVNLTVSNFVPKPHTPFQWFPPDSPDTLREKIAYLRARFKGVPGVKLSTTDTQWSLLEAVIAKGDAALADVMEAAYRKGAYLDAWGEPAAFQAWFDALAEAGIDPVAYVRQRLTDPDAPLPWDVVDVGLSKQWLRTEYQRACEAASTTPCFETCSACGVCATYNTWPRFIDLPEGGVTERRAKLRVLQTPAPASVTVAGKHAGGPPASSHTLPAMKARIRIEKRGPLRFISHLDWLRMLHRALRRARWPVAMSQGFHPNPKVAFSPALPLFCEGLGEYIDVSLTAQVSEETLWAMLENLNRYLPETGKTLSVTALPAIYPSIDEQLLAMDYIARWTCDNGELGYNMAERLLFLTQQYPIFTVGPNGDIVPGEVRREAPNSPKPYKATSAAPDPSSSFYTGLINDSITTPATTAGYDTGRLALALDATGTGVCFRLERMQSHWAAALHTATGKQPQAKFLLKPRALLHWVDPHISHWQMTRQALVLAA